MAATPATVNPPPLNPIEQRQAQADCERQRTLDRLTGRLAETNTQIQRLRKARAQMLIEQSNYNPVIDTGRLRRAGSRGFSDHTSADMELDRRLHHFGLGSWNGHGLIELERLVDALRDAIAELESPANPSAMGR
jgi:hypothetical protein